MAGQYGRTDLRYSHIVLPGGGVLAGNRNGRWMGKPGLSSDDVASLTARARAVGNRIGWELRFAAAEDPQFVGLTAGARQVFVVGPTQLVDLSVDDVIEILDALARGTRRILDEEVPRLI